MEDEVPFLDELLAARVGGVDDGHGVRLRDGVDGAHQGEEILLVVDALLPVGGEQEAEPLFYQPLNVVPRQFGVPAAVHVEKQRTQAQLLLRKVGQVRAVNATADPKDTVEVLPLSVAANGIHGAFRLGAPLLARVTNGQDGSSKVPAVVADALLVKRNQDVGRVHDAIGAAPVFDGHSFTSVPADFSNR